jgi:hypothetical protein
MTHTHRQNKLPMLHEKQRLAKEVGITAEEVGDYMRRWRNADREAKALHKFAEVRGLQSSVIGCALIRFDSIRSTPGSKARPSVCQYDTTGFVGGARTMILTAIQTLNPKIQTPTQLDRSPGSS